MYDIISRERAGLLDPKKRTPINESYIKGLTVHYTGAAVSPSTKSEKARKSSFKARHAKNIAKGKMSAAWWANKVKW